MIINREHFPVSVAVVEGGGLEVKVSDDTYRIMTDWELGDPLVEANVNGRHVCFQVDDTGPGYLLSYRGAQVDALVVSHNVAALEQRMLEKEPPDLSKFLLSPMPGLLVRLRVGEGDEVKAGEELAVVEAMKMENSLRASEDSIVAKVMAEEGDSLVVDQPILEFQ